VLIGSCAVSSLTLVNFLGGLRYLQSTEWTVQNLGLPVALIVITVLVSIFLSLFERFEHSLTAILFGASMPSLLLGISVLSAPR
jgi:hypothetical protein